MHIGYALLQQIYLQEEKHSKNIRYSDWFALILQNISTCWKPKGQAGGFWLYGNGRLLSACLWHVVTSQLTIIVKGRWQPVNAHGKVYCALPWIVVYVLIVCIRLLTYGIIYIPCVGFQRCPSRRLGQCEGLDMWDGQRRIPRFVFVEVLQTFYNYRRRLGFYPHKKVEPKCIK